MTFPNDLNASTRDARLSALQHHVEANTNGINDVPFTQEVNNHVHTTYSFSPYSPTAAAWMARASGLGAVGSVDHDSISAARETISAAKILGIGSTVGCEVRVNFTGTAIEGRMINNPDSPNLAYMVFHGVATNRIDEVDAFLAPIRARRNERNRRETEAMSDLLEAAGAPRVDFGAVEAASLVGEGGGITERHILYAAGVALMSWMQPGPPLRRFVEANLTGDLAPRLRSFLDDPGNPHYVYDLLGAMKGSFLPKFFVQPTEDECIPVADAVGFANSIEAISAYAYLGDVGESPTGDKKAAKFEDDYLDELFEVIADVGYRAVTYMPPRNTVEQLRRVQSLCSRHRLMEISGVDINSSRQVFTCPEVLEPDFRHLVDATWALIAHEKLSTADPNLSLFSDRNPVEGDLATRIERYAGFGRAIDPHNPEAARSAAGL
ncbi:MAG: PHP domain-containing protein [Spirochaetota bacterium]